MFKVTKKCSFAKATWVVKSNLKYGHEHDKTKVHIDHNGTIVYLNVFL